MSTPWTSTRLDKEWVLDRVLGFYIQAQSQKWHDDDKVPNAAGGSGEAGFAPLLSPPLPHPRLLSPDCALLVGTWHVKY